MNMKRSIIVNPLWNVMDRKNQDEHLNRIIESDIFSVVEIWDTLDESIVRVIKKYSQYIEFDVSLSILMSEQNYDINSCDLAKVNLAFEYLTQRIDFWSNIGIKNISLSSPLCNHDVSRNKQIEKFKKVLKKICEFAEKRNVLVCFEAFDVFEDKKRLLGTTYELDRLFKDLECKNLFLTWDLGHMCLNHEDYINSLRTLNRYIRRIHISNYSLDKNKWYFGDKHLPFDEKGRIFNSDIKNILEYLRAMNLNVSIAFEVASNYQIFEVNTFEKAYRYVCLLMCNYILFFNNERDGNFI